MLLALSIFALIGLFGAFLVLFHRKPIYNALGLLLNFLSLAIIYFLLNAPFLGVIQIIVYSGAIVVFFLFVIMLLNLREPLMDFDFSFKGLLSIITIIALFILVSVTLYIVKLPKFELGEEGKVSKIGELLLTNYLVPFELASILLLLAIVIAIIIGRKQE
ncbi:MAG: NADH-quinone oxidoreductase subunit J [candidate division WOR-3 bacterium]|jgi:NADH-quinone oxidoreductase subunit J